MRAAFQMLSHVTIGVSNIDRALTFYEPLMSALGLLLKFSDEKWAGWVQPEQGRPIFIITRPFDGTTAEAGNGHMVALLARKRSLVARSHAIALQNGGTDEGRPGLRPEYHSSFYGAYFRDPDGNKLCVCCHDRT